MLDALERGEMKFESNGGVSSCSEDEDEDEEVDPLSIDTPATPTLGTVKVSFSYFDFTYDYEFYLQAISVNSHVVVILVFKSHHFQITEPHLWSIIPFSPTSTVPYSFLWGLFVCNFMVNGLVVVKFVCHAFFPVH